MYFIPNFVALNYRKMMLLTHMRIYRNQSSENLKFIQMFTHF